MDSSVQNNSTPDKKTLHVHITEDFETVGHHLGVFERVRHSKIRRVHTCVEANGVHFHRLL